MPKNLKKVPRKKTEPKLRIRGRDVPLKKLDMESAKAYLEDLDKRLTTQHSVDYIANRLNASINRALNIAPEVNKIALVDDSKIKTLDDFKKQYSKAPRVNRRPIKYVDIGNRFFRHIKDESSKKANITTARIFAEECGIYTLNESTKASKTALALSGGGAKGSFEAGAILYLERSEQLEDLDLVTGTSVGAINALGVSSWKSEAGTEIGQVWLSLLRNSDMFVDSEDFEKIKDILDQLDIDLDGGVGGISGVLPGRMSWEDLRIWLAMPIIGHILGIVGFELVRGKIELASELFARLMRLEQVYSLEPTGNLLRQAFPAPTDDNMPMIIVLVNAGDGHSYYLDQTGVARKMDTRFPRKSLGDHWLIAEDLGDTLIEGAIASSTIPLIFGRHEMVMSTTSSIKNLAEFYQAIVDEGGSLDDLTYIGGFKRLLDKGKVIYDGYWDGGVRDVLPLHAAADAGATRVIAVSASHREFEPSPSGGLIDGLMKTISIMNNEVSETDRLHSAGIEDVIFVDPEFSVHEFDQIDPGLIRINFEYGYMKAFNALEEIPRQVNDWLDGSLLGTFLFSLWALSALTSAEEIAALRKEIWNLEATGFTPFPTPRIVWDPSTLAKLRSKKKELFELYKGRKEIWDDINAVPDPLPDGTPLSDAWLRWERRTPGLVEDALRLAARPFERQRIRIGNLTGPAQVASWEPTANIPDPPS